MTTSISAVNAGSSSVSEMVVKKSTLSDSTKAQLEALGITATDGMTESEAQAKIAAAKQEQNAQNQGGEEQGNSSESEMLAEAKSLAASVGVSVSSDADLTEILDDIGAELEVMLEAASKLNEGMLAARAQTMICDLMLKFLTTEESKYSLLPSMSPAL